MDITIAIFITLVGAATPILIAALGELVVEKAGVLNLGVEGMMLVGAIAGFAAQFYTGNPYLALLAEYPETLARVARIVGASPWASQYLARYPILLDSLIEWHSLLEPPDFPVRTATEFGRIKNDAIIPASAANFAGDEVFTVSVAVLLSCGHVTVICTGTVPSCIGAVHGVCRMVRSPNVPVGESMTRAGLASAV